MLQEYRFDLSPTIAGQPRPGGGFRRRSQTTFVNLGGARKLVSSDPPGLVASQLRYPEVNSTFTSASLSGVNSGYYFSHWEINGVRAADDVGIGLSQVSELMDTDKQIIVAATNKTWTKMQTACRTGTSGTLLAPGKRKFVGQ